MAKITTMQNTIRTFIAIELNKTIRDELADIQSKLKISGADVKWVKPENIHLTLKFLGAVEKNKIDTIKNILDSTTSQIEPFDVALSVLGGFPNLNSPRVIWVGIDVGARHAVPLLVNKIENALSKLGFPKDDRPFSAHITLGRVHSPKNKQQLKKIIDDINKNGHTSKCVPILIDHITLFQSSLTETGPIYHILHEAKLKTT